MKRFFILFLFAFAIFACSKKKASIPEDILSMKDMQEILADIHLAQAASASVVLSDSSIYNTKEYVNYILKDHHVTRERFLTSMKFYTENPALLEEVYDSVITDLSKLQSESEVH